MTVGERIKQRREELGLSQTELAKKMGYSGKASVSKAETWGDNLTTTKVLKFAEALGCSFEYLMGWEETEDKFVFSDEMLKFDLLIMQLTPESQKSALQYLQYLLSTQNGESKQ